MATISSDNIKLVSNQVFTKPQDCSEIFKESTGTIIYANNFSGISPVSMPKEYRDCLNNDFGETGNNVIIQLKQKVQQFPDGPWYVDSRDGIIYIHNRKLQEPPRVNYTYQSGNGELLNISFETQYLRKDLRGSTSLGVSPDKGFGTNAVVLDQLTPDMKTRFDYTRDDGTIDSQRAIKDYERGLTTYGQMTALKEEGKLTEDQWKVVMGIYKRDRDIYRYDLKSSGVETQYEVYQANEAKKYGGGASEELKRATKETLENKDLTVNVAEFLASIYGPQATDKQVELDNAAKNGTLEDLLKREFSQTTYTFNPEGHPRDWGGAYIEVYGIANQAPDSNGHISIEDLNKNPNVKVLSTVQNDGTVKVFKKLRAYKTVSGYQLLSAHYSHKYAAKDAEKRIMAAINNSKNVIERKLSARATVVGRPSLATSQIITLSNVGKRWSGSWYIKMCTHNMDPNSGYTTLMELVKHNGMEGYSCASNQGDHDVSVDSNNPSKLNSNPITNINLTTIESAWYNSSNRTTQEKEDLLIMKMAGVESPVIPIGNDPGNLDLARDLKLKLRDDTKVTKEMREKYGRQATEAVNNNRTTTKLN